MPTHPGRSLAAGRTTTPANRLGTLARPGNSVRHSPSVRVDRLVNDRFPPSADFEVKDSLPNVTWPLPRSFAGNIPVNRVGHRNCTLYFWGFEKEQGSLTADANDRTNEPWGIWLNGGSERLFDHPPNSRILTFGLHRPGSSSLLGLTSEVGDPS